ncbi:beta-ketoacyl reductase [Actinoalloteichus sp. AHMU CJ021]|uniref:beta-ketoacyl reductase n=1 Tax=Actinoalloteichus sp. AHMU CJ021 TaxID=2072503 RepID=UPI003FCDB35C
MDGWRYRVEWQPVVEAPAEPLVGTWLVAAPDDSDDEVTAWVTGALSRHGAEVVPVLAGTDPEALAARLAPVAGAVAGVVSVTWDGAASTVTLLRALDLAAVDAPLWCVTRDAVAAQRTDTVSRPDQAQVWGIGRVAALEYPRRWGGLVDLPGSLDERAANRLTGVLAAERREDQVAIRSGGVFACRLVTAPLGTDAPGWTPRGTVLITDGPSRFGVQLARWAVARGAEHVLLARDPAEPDGAELERELTRDGGRVTVLPCDLADRRAVADLLAVATADPERPLTAVVHTADHNARIPLALLDPIRYDELISSQVGGAVNLDELLGDRQLDAFVLFSSVAAVWGGAEQAAYAAANAVVDSLAERRRRRGLAATSVAWGPWAGTSELEDQLRRFGLIALDPESAVAALSRAVADGEPRVVVADVDWKRFAPAFTSSRPSPLLGDLEAVRSALSDVDEPDGDAGPAQELRNRLAGVSQAEQTRLLVELVSAQAAAVLGHLPGDVFEQDRAFRDLGFDSLTAVELRTRLSKATRLKLPASLVFDYPTPTVMARYLREQITGDGADAADLLAELDRLESSSASVEWSNLTRAKVTMRIKAFLSRLTGPAEEDNVGDIVDSIDSASDEEIFDMIRSGE